MDLLEILQAAKRAASSHPNPDEIAPIDPHLVEAAIGFVEAIEGYFRAEVHGVEQMPEGKALVVGNHNAGITFLEPMFLARVIYRRNGELLRYLAHDTIVDLPGLGPLLTSLGAIRASHETAAKAFAAGQKVMVFPGGNHEAFRPFRDRHKVDFGGKKGFLRLALRHQVPIVPVLSIGGHETFFVLRRGRRIADILGTRRLLRSESFPIFVGLPWGVWVGPMFHLPLPAKCLVEVGPPITLDGYGPEDQDDPAKLNVLYDLVQGRLQAMMDRRAKERRFPVLG
jgi:1-acyl-sn-glycerol-3-phosphate acyltransferase